MQISPPIITPDLVAKPVLEIATDGPTYAILPLPQLLRTRPIGHGNIQVHGRSDRPYQGTPFQRFTLGLRTKLDFPPEMPVMSVPRMHNSKVNRWRAAPPPRTE